MVAPFVKKFFFLYCHHQSLPSLHLAELISAPLVPGTCTQFFWHVLTRWCCSQQLVCGSPTPLSLPPFRPHFPHLLQHRFLEVRYDFYDCLVISSVNCTITCLVNLRFACSHCFLSFRSSMAGIILFINSVSLSLTL